jgi:hypothetical protein
VCGAQGGICEVNKFFVNPVACCFLYKAKDLSVPLVVYVASNGRMIDELERMWKEAVVA